MRKIIYAIAALCFIFNNAVVAQLHSGNLLVERVGTGSAALTSGATAVFIDEYTTSGSSVQSIAIAASTSGSINQLTESGSASSDGGMNLSTDSNYVTVSGYDAPIPTTGVASASVNKVIAMYNLAAVEKTGVCTNATTFKGSNVRSSFTKDGTQFWLAGSGGGSDGGIDSIAFSGTSTATAIASTQVSKATNNSNNTRVVKFVNGGLYYSSGAGTGFFGISRVLTGAALPRSTSLIINTGTGNPYNFVFKDSLAPYSGSNIGVCYIADLTAGVQKWTNTGIGWTLAYTMALGTGAGAGAFGLAVDFSGTNPVIYATTGEASANRIVSITDAGSGSTYTTIATGATNTYLRGLCFAPKGAVLNVSPLALTGFSTDVANPSAAQSFTISGNYLPASPGTVSIGNTDQTDWEISTDGGSTWAGTASLSYNTTTGTLASSAIKVRIKSGSTLGSKTANLSCSVTGAYTKTVVVNGTVGNTASVAVNPTTATEIPNTPITITVTTTSAVTSNSTVNYTISGTGISGSRFLSGGPLTGTITILAGNTTGTATVTVTDDGVADAGNVASVTLSSPTVSITSVTATAATFTITDAEAAYYWNGSTNSTSSGITANGGLGTWNTTNTNWVEPTNPGTGSAWLSGSNAVFAGTPGAGTVTLANNETANSITVNAGGYTFTNTANVNLTSNVNLGSNVNLSLDPTNFTLSYSGTLAQTVAGNGSNLTLTSSQNGANYGEVAFANGTAITAPVTITNTGTTTFGIGTTGTPAISTISGPVTLNQQTGAGNIFMCGASAPGNILEITGAITGTGNINFSTGTSGGKGTLWLNAATTGQNTFAGNIIMAATAASGSLRAGSASGISGIPSTATLSFPTSTFGGTFDLYGCNIQIAGLSSSTGAVGNITNSAAGTGTNTLTVNQSVPATFGIPITDGATAKTAVIKSGSDTLTLSGLNTFTGGLSINQGFVEMGGTGNILANNLAITLNGGGFSTGATTAFDEAVGTLLLTDNSVIKLGAGSHTLKFNNSSTLAWTAGKTLTINGWLGSAGTSGTSGKLFVGIDATGLTATQLAQITFNGFNPGAIILSTGEIVPASSNLVIVPGNLSFGAVSVGSPSAQQSFTVTGSILASTVVITPPAGYQISQTSGSGFQTGAITLNTTGGVLNTTTIYVEFVPVTGGTDNNNITVISGSASGFVALTGTGIVTYYSQASGKVTGAVWAVTPTGTAQTAAALGGFSSAINVVIQNGHTITTSISQELTAKNLTINAGGVLRELTSSSTGPYYINLYGNLTVNGQLGGLNGADSLGINANGANDTITGNGTINMQRIRNNNASANLIIDANINLWWIGASIYNNVASSTFNVTLNAGKTVNFEGQSDISVNGIAGATSGRGGIYTVNGTMTGLDTVYGFASATAFSPSGIVIGNGGLMSANFVKVGIGGAGNFSFTVNTGGELDVNKVLQLQTGVFAPAGNVVMKSTSVSQVAVIDNFSSSAFNGTYSGQITAQRYYAASTIYTQQHEMGMPVNAPLFSQLGSTTSTGAYIIPGTGCNEIEAASNSPYGKVFSIHENAPNASSCGMSQWYVEPAANNAINGMGYSVLMQGPATLSLTGTPNLTSSYTVSNLSNSGWSNVTLQNHTLKAGWQLVGNPYLATLNLTTANTGFDNQVLVWNAEGAFAGTYQSTTVGTNAVIAPFQGFLVHKTSTGTGGTYTIKASDRTLAPQTFYVQNDNQLDILATNLSTGLLDKTTIAFNTNATDTFDALFDANKPAGSLNRHTLYSVNDGDWMSVNTLHNVATTSVVPVGFEAGANANYSFSFGNVNTFDATSYIYLEDLRQHTMYNVRNGNYQFSADSADDWNRFVLHFTPAAVINTTAATCNSQGSISINQPGTANWNYTLTDENNTILSSGVLNQANGVNISAVAGNYTLTLIDNNNYTVTKTIQVSGAAPVIAAFNTPQIQVTAQTAVTFVNASQNANSYSWNFGDGTTSSLISPAHTYTNPGSYTVTLIAANVTGCTNTATQTVAVNTTTGINTIAANGINIWSNKNNIYIDFSQLDKVDAQIKVYDVLGQELLRDEFNSNTLYEKQLDNTNAACVIISVKNNGTITTQKIFLISTLK